jgi:hypothetical protein
VISVDGEGPHYVTMHDASRSEYINIVDPNTPLPLSFS